jgi:YVTN family beta-propeller protein
MVADRRRGRRSSFLLDTRTIHLGGRSNRAHVVTSGLLFLIVLSTSASASAGAQVCAYVTNAGSDTVSVINTDAMLETTTIPVGSDPEGIAVTPDGSFVYVSNVTPGFTDFGTVSVIRSASRRVVATATVGKAPGGIAVTPDGARVYVAESGGLINGEFLPPSVTVIDTSTNLVAGAPIALGPGSSNGIAISPNGDFAYVVNAATSGLSVIGTMDNRVTKSIRLGGGSADALALTPDGTRAYIVSRSGSPGDDKEGGVIVFDTMQTKVVGAILLGTQYSTDIAITPNGKFAYVAQSCVGGPPCPLLDSRVSIIDTSNNSVSATAISVGGDSPAGIAFTPDGAFAYLTGTRSNSVYVISTASSSVVATIPVGSYPTAIAISSTENGCPLPPNGLPGDGNCDGRRTAADLTAVATILGNPPHPSCPLADFNQDGVVDEEDLANTITFEFNP